MNAQPGKAILSADEIVRRFELLGRPGRRTSPSAPAAASPDAQALRPRGDHDLNPDMYEPAEKLTPAAVLVPIVERAEGLTVLLTKRTAHLHDHAGQVSFPGGRVDPGDSGPVSTALRETEEEIGLARHHVRLIGQLDTYVTRTGFEISPLVGLIAPPFELRPDDFEVAEVFEVPLGFILDPASQKRQSRMFKGALRHFYVFPYDDYYIWGATAGMLVNLTEVLGNAD
ncbi:CoA pyrophosphatase [Denitrobaculum tricleocarpae]